jgi:hypothetical protein
MQNIRYSSLFLLYFKLKTLEYSHVIIKNRNEIQIYIDSSRGKKLGFYNNYESIPQV